MKENDSKLLYLMSSKHLSQILVYIAVQQAFDTTHILPTLMARCLLRNKYGSQSILQKIKSSKLEKKFTFDICTPRLR
jgi:hypothetical protein